MLSPYNAKEAPYRTIICITGKARGSTAQILPDAFGQQPFKLGVKKEQTCPLRFTSMFCFFIVQFT